MPRLLLLALSVAIAPSALAQAATSPPPGTLAAQLHQLAIAAEDLRNNLPNFTCTESLISQELRNGKVHNQVKASGDIRVQLDPGGKPTEHFQVAEVNGRPSTRLRAPMFVAGGFQNALDLFRPANQPCFDFTASANRIDYATSTRHPSECNERSGITGFVLFDADGNPRHLEHRIPFDIAHRRNVVPLGVLDLTPTSLGGATFFLSTHVVADIPEDKSTYHWEATYTNCRLYTVSVTISPATDTAK